MKSQRTKEIKVGIVSFIGIILLIIGIALGKGFSVSIDQKLVKFRFPNSGGIKISAPVVVNGVKRGSVQSITNDKQSVIIEAFVSSPADFRSDVSARITILEITGGKKIEINPGKSPQSFDLANEISGTTAADIGDLVALVGDVSGDAVALIRRLDTIAAAGTELLADGKFIADLKETATEANSLARNANTLLDDNYQYLSQSIKNIRILTGDLKDAVQKHEPSVGRIINQLQVVLDDTKSFLSGADSVAASATILINNIDDIAREIRNGSGFASKLLFDPDFMRQMDSTLTEMSKLIYQINNHGVNVNIRLGSRP